MNLPVAASHTVSITVAIPSPGRSDLVLGRARQRSPCRPSPGTAKRVSAENGNCAFAWNWLWTEAPAACVAGDVRDEVFAAGLVAVALERFGRLDAAFNNANARPVDANDWISLGDWSDTMAVNLTGAFLAAKHQLPAMVRQGSGSVTFTSSFVGYTTGFPRAAAYAASKAGIVGLTQALAAEFGAQNVRVNALLPGGTDTPMARVMNTTQEALGKVASLHAMKRLAQPEEIARVALFLASEGASFATGSALLADGGVSVYRAS